MTYRFVHIGDLHLHAGPRQVDRLRCLDQIILECAGLPDLAAWLLPGDLFDAKSGVGDRNALKERVKQMANCAPVLICYGNHDAPGDLDIFGDIGARYLVHVNAVPVVSSILLTSRTRASVFFLPWPTEAGLVSAGIAPDRLAQEARVALDVICADAGHALTEARKRGEPTLMLGHVNVVGAQLKSVGQPEIGAQIEVDQSQLDRLGHCYKALNHVHIAQEVAGAHYAGSVCRLSWGETEPKSYNVVTYQWIDNAATSDYPSWWEYHVESHVLDVAPMYHVEGWLTRDGLTDVQVLAGPEGALLAQPTIVCEWCEGAGETALSASSRLPCDYCHGSGLLPSWSGCEVRLRARYRQSEGLILADAQRQAKLLFQAAMRFEFEPICVPDRGLRAPEVAVARTFQEKLAAWAVVSGVVLPAHVVVKAALLESPNADVVVAAVEQQMAELSGMVKEEERLSKADDDRDDWGGSIFGRMN